LFSLDTKKVNFVLPLTSYFVPLPEDFRDAFCVTGGALGRPWYVITRELETSRFRLTANRGAMWHDITSPWK